MKGPGNPSNHKIFKWFGFADSEAEIRLKRLRYWQRVCRDVQAHMQVVAALVCRIEACDLSNTKKRNKHTGLDKDGFITDDSNPWAKQLWADIQTLQRYDDTKSLFTPLLTETF